MISTLCAMIRASAWRWASCRDRARDLPASVVETIAARFEGWEEAAHWTSLLRDPHASLVQSEQEWLFGDRLPTGLILRDAAP